MKLLRIILLSSVLIPTICFSQVIQTNTGNNIVEITTQQLKTSNLIFNEHEKWTKEIPILNNQINNLELINKSYKSQDSLRVNQINLYNKQLNLYNSKLSTYESQIKKLKFKKSAYKIGGIGTTIIAFIIGVLCNK